MISLFQGRDHDPLEVPASEPRTRRPRWYLLYFLLAAFDVITVSTSLFLNHQLTDNYSEAVVRNQDWAKRLADLSTLREMAGAVNAPGNDVFDSLDVDRESARLVSALGVFDQQMARVVSDFGNIDITYRPQLTGDVGAVSHAMEAMVREANLIFGFFQSGEPDRAGRRMATMDRAYARLNAALTAVERRVRDIQAIQLTAQSQQAAALKRIEYVIAALILLMISGVMIYGHAMSSAVRRASDEREHYLTALRASDSRTSAIVRSAQDGIFTFTETGDLQSANPALTSLLGYSSEQLERMQVWEFLPQATRNVPAFVAECLMSPEEPARTWVALAADGVERSVELSVAEIPAEDGRLFCVVMHDVTASRHVAAALEQAKDAAEEANRSKSAFLANMSHELRTPLNAIIGYSEMLQETAEDRMDAEMATDLTSIQTAGRHLLGLINDVLDLSKIEAGKATLHLEDVDIRAILDDVEATAAPLAASRHNHLTFQVPVDLDAIQTDALKLRQILLNLVANACKFTEDGAITVTAAMTGTTEARVLEVAVQDSGIGMNPDQVQRLFKPFSQADSSTTKRYGGTGLGLAVSKQFATLLGGDIAVNSDEGRGSRFVVRLPFRRLVDRVPDSTPHADEVPAPAPLGPYVLVVDDDPMTRTLISRQLTRAGMAVQVAETGSDAIRMARQSRPAAITLDLLLPDVHGWSVLSMFKSDPALAAVPIIIVSVVEDRQVGYALGAADYIVKPVDGAHLARTLKRLLPAGSRHSVLIADDDRDAREVLARRVTEMGASIIEAEDGRIALDMLRTARPNLVLLDLMMPGVDGFTVIERMREDEALRDIPVVVVTARDMSDEDLQRLSGSVSQLVRKHPHSLAEVTRFVQGHLDAATRRVA